MRSVVNEAHAESRRLLGADRSLISPTEERGVGAWCGTHHTYLRMPGLSCRFYQHKFPEVEDVVMVNVRSIAGNGRLCQLTGIQQHRRHDSSE